MDYQELINKYMHCDCGGDIEINKFTGDAVDWEADVDGVILECKKCKKVLELKKY